MRRTVEGKFDNARDEVNPNKNNTQVNPKNFAIASMKTYPGYPFLFWTYPEA
jgi:hypothetical protein